ncbi:MAG: CotH kinase family protein [Planctomycetes bacterium]|nr:CotH kinase family protein [Planctomycetota bacterium]
MRRRSRLHDAWQWSWIVTVPIAIAWSLWGIDTWRHWRHFATTYDAGELSPSLREVGRERWLLMQRQAAMPFGPHLAGIEPELQLPNVQLFVAGSDLALLDRDLPYSGFDDVTARLIHDDGARKVKVRYRGDLLPHWADAKKSWRIKTEADELFCGMRAFNLIAPKSASQVDDFLGYRLAALLGLIAPRCEPVNLFVNGHNRGLHLLTEQLDEGTLRRHDRMPGDLYRGDLIGRDLVRGAGDLAFEQAAQWTKVATNNHYDLDSRAPLEALLQIVAGPIDAAGQARLVELLDIDAWGRFGAFELLTQTTQYDEHHNWYLFWDPWRRTFEPVVWDPAAWSAESRASAEIDGIAIDVTTSRLQQWLLTNGEFLAARHRALATFFAEGSADRFDNIARLAFAAARAAVACDPQPRPAASDAIEQAMQACDDFRRHTAATLRSAYLEAREPVRWSRVDGDRIRLELEGRRPITAIVLRCERPAPSGATTELEFLRCGVTHALDLSGATRRRDRELRIEVELFAQTTPVLGGGGDGRGHRQPSVTTYDLHVPGLDAAVPVAVEVGRGAIPGGDHLESAEATPALGRRNLDQLFEPTRPRPPLLPRNLRGTVRFEGFTELDGEVTIEPGTTILLAEGASLRCRGRVTALGSEERPIRFVPEGRDALPWGTIALDGAGCSGSHLRWCEVIGGSGHKEALAEYSAMFSIHGCRDVLIEDCRFAENHRFDDAVHAVYAEVTFDRVTIEGALSDALDCDISTVVIRHCTFAASGNDGVDLMTTAAIVHDCNFEHNGDKGISIGEGSQLLAVRNRFQGCGLAFEAKDGSVAHVANCAIRGCKHALNAYKKNWRYAGGGTVTLLASLVSDNGAGPTSDHWSRTVLVDCRLEDELAAEFEQQYVDGSMARMRNTVTVVDTGAGPGQPLPFPTDLPALAAGGDELWRSVRRDTRGVPDDR